MKDHVNIIQAKPHGKEKYRNFNHDNRNKNRVALTGEQKRDFLVEQWHIQK